MQVLTTSDEIQRRVIHLLKKHDSLSWAVAWASVGFNAAKMLRRHKDKIDKLVVGTHFHQTHPDFIKEYMVHDRVRFVLNPSGVFHPKVYFFSTGDLWEAVVGSANFTSGGMGKNSEVAVHVSSDDDGAADALQSLTGTIEAFWEDGEVLNESDLEGYRVIWKKNRRRLAGLSGAFTTESKHKGPKADGGRAPLEIEILRMPWSDFYRQVCEDEHHSVQGRIDILNNARKLFEHGTHLCDMSDQDRKRIAGTVRSAEENFDWRWFGSMVGAGTFNNLINTNSPRLSLALDQIPHDGNVTRDDFMSFIYRFKTAFEGLARGGRIATASRLLAMKRPDVFVCVDSKNQHTLCQAFGIPYSNLGFERYWDSVIRRIQEAAWWQPIDDTQDTRERDVWNGRAAFLDALYYEGLPGDG